MIISFIQAIFTVLFFFVTIPIYNGFLLMGYSTIYTSMPIFSIILDCDVNSEKVLEFPALYVTLQKGRALNFKTFMIWSWKSIVQAAIIMFVAIVYFDNSFVNIVTITFTTLILIEILNVFSVVTKIVWQMVVVTLLTLIMYFLSIILLQNYIQVSAIDGPFMLRVVCLTIVTWLPLHILNKIIEKIDPN